MKKYYILLATLVVSVVIVFGQQAQANEKPHVNTAKPESTVPWEYDEMPVQKLTTSSASNAVIADISQWQGDINWAKASKVLDLAIIRTQYGTKKEDKKHRANEKAAIKYNVPFGVYSFMTAGTPAQARAEARALYNRSSKSALFYVVDIEVNTARKGYSMRKLSTEYVNELRKLTNKKVGLYIANHKYKSFNINTKQYDFVWIPRYSKSKPNYNYHLWQYTDSGRVDGIKGNVDLNRLSSTMSVGYFTSNITKVSNAALAKKYYLVNPKYVKLKNNVTVYKSVNFTKKNRKKTLKKGQVIQIKAVKKSASGTPHLQLKDGTYITAAKSSVVKTAAPLSKAKIAKTYYTTNPKYVKLKKSVNVYSKVNFDQKYKKTTYAKNKVIKVRKVIKTTSGIPRLQLTNGLYISANKSLVTKSAAPTTAITNSTKAASNAKYYGTEDKVKQIMTLKDLYTYSTLVTNQNKQFVPAYTVFNVSKALPNGSGENKFQIINGRFITANKDDVVEVPETISNYYRDIQENLQTQKDVYMYTNLMFGEDKNPELLAIGTNVQIKSITFNKLGYPRYVLSNGKYISTKKTLFKKIRKHNR